MANKKYLFVLALQDTDNTILQELIQQGMYPNRSALLREAVWDLLDKYGYTPTRIHPQNGGWRGSPASIKALENAPGRLKHTMKKKGNL